MSLSIEEAKKQLRLARLAEHKKNIAKFLQSGNDRELANACSSFKAMFQIKGKVKQKSA